MMKRTRLNLAALLCIAAASLVALLVPGLWSADVGEEGEREPWSYATVLTFCEEQKWCPLTVIDELHFVVVKMREREEEEKARLVEITPTITFILRDDPSTNDFLTLETYNTRREEKASEPILDDLKICE